jgi:hypothetical protein
MGPNWLRTGRWIVGGAVFMAAATILFEAAGQSSVRPTSLVQHRGSRVAVAVAGVRANTYRTVATDDRDVRTALDFALADQRKKNRSDSAISLRNVLSAEHQASKGDNYRLCLSLDRRGRPDTARTVVHRNQKQQWSVALWAWGACKKPS